MDVTVDDIPGGSSTFAFQLNMTNGSSVSISTIPLSNGQTYSFDVSSAGDTPTNFVLDNLAGGGNGMSITNIVFYT